MRYRTENSVNAFFVDDIHGGVRVQCESCENEQDDFTTWGEPSQCIFCGSEMHYPEGADW